MTTLLAAIAVLLSNFLVGLYHQLTSKQKQVLLLGDAFGLGTTEEALTHLRAAATHLLDANRLRAASVTFITFAFGVSPGYGQVNERGLVNAGLEANVYDLAGPSLLSTLGGTSSVVDLDMSPNGLTGAFRSITGVTFVDMSTGGIEGTFATDAISTSGGPQVVLTNTRALVSIGLNVEVYNLVGPSLLATRGDGSSVLDMDVSPDGSVGAFRHATGITFVDMATGASKGTFPTDAIELDGFGPQVVLTNTHALVEVGLGVQVYELAGPSLLTTLGDGSSVLDMDVSPDGSVGAFRHATGITFVDMATGTSEGTFQINQIDQAFYPQVLLASKRESSSRYWASFSGFLPGFGIFGPPRRPPGGGPITVELGGFTFPCEGQFPVQEVFITSERDLAAIDVLAADPNFNVNTVIAGKTATVEITLTDPCEDGNLRIKSEDVDGRFRIDMFRYESDDSQPEIEVTDNPGNTCPRVFRLTVQDDSRRTVADAPDIPIGLLSIEALAKINAQENIPNFEIGTNDVVEVEVEQVDPCQLGRATIKVTDCWMCNIVEEEIVFIEEEDPVCRLETVSNTQIRVIGQDFDAGMEKVEVLQIVNAVATIPPFEVGTQAEVPVDVTKVNPDQRASVTMRFTDTCECEKECDPILTILSADLPDQFRLYQNYPNPSLTRTSISFQVSETVHVTLEIHDLLGRHVATLIDEEIKPGTYAVRWDGTNSGGLPVTAGTYVYRIRAGSFTDSRTMTLLN